MRLSFVQIALPASALLIFLGLWARQSATSGLGGAMGGGTQTVSLNPEERAVILDRIRQEVSSAQQQNELAFTSLTKRLHALETATVPVMAAAAPAPPALNPRGARNVNLHANQGRWQGVHSAVAASATADGYALQSCPGVLTPPGKAARSRKEVMDKSKADPQYGMGIVQARPDNLVNSKDYWETRYAMGGNSGAGSYNKIAIFKAKIMNQFVAENDIQHVIEFGFGDGAQLMRAKYPEYTGLDVSETIFKKTKQKFKDDPTKHFLLYDGDPPAGLIGDCTLTFDVIYHLVEDAVYAQYMDALFKTASKYVVVYSSNIAGWHGAAHVLHRDNTGYIAQHFPQWKLVGTLQSDYPEKTAQDFFFYAKC